MGARCSRQCMPASCCTCQALGHCHPAVPAVCPLAGLAPRWVFAPGSVLRVQLQACHLVPSQLLQASSCPPASASCGAVAKPDAPESSQAHGPLTVSCTPTPRPSLLSAGPSHTPTAFTLLLRCLASLQSPLQAPKHMWTASYTPLRPLSLPPSFVLKPSAGPRTSMDSQGHPTGSIIRRHKASRSRSASPHGFHVTSSVAVPLHQPAHAAPVRQLSSVLSEDSFAEGCCICLPAEPACMCCRGSSHSCQHALPYCCCLQAAKLVRAEACAAGWWRCLSLQRGCFVWILLHHVS